MLLSASLLLEICRTCSDKLGSYSRRSVRRSAAQQKYLREIITSEFVGKATSTCNDLQPYDSEILEGGAAATAGKANCSLNIDKQTV